MRTKNIQQEILLVTSSTFSQRAFSLKDQSESNAHLSQPEQLEQACWNGLLTEILAGIIQKDKSGKSLCLWEIRHCSSFLEIELCQAPGKITREFSIDPYIFLSSLINN